MIQQEHHKTEFHLCEIMAEISFCKLKIYHLTGQWCIMSIIYIGDVYRKIYSFKHQSLNIFTSYWVLIEALGNSAITMSRYMYA
jgi:hypothetical protein